MSLPPSSAPLVSGLLDGLESAARDRLSALLSDASQPKLASALKSLAEFEAASGRVLFRQAATRDDLQASLWNEWTFILYAEWMSRRRSRRLGRCVRAATISEYISMMKIHLECAYGFELSADNPRRLRRFIKAR